MKIVRCGIFLKIYNFYNTKFKIKILSNVSVRIDKRKKLCYKKPLRVNKILDRIFSCWWRWENLKSVRYYLMVFSVFFRILHKKRIFYQLFACFLSVTLIRRKPKETGARGAKRYSDNTYHPRWNQVFFTNTKSKKIVDSVKNTKEYINCRGLPVLFLVA